MTAAKRLSQVNIHTQVNHQTTDTHTHTRTLRPSAHLTSTHPVSPTGACATGTGSALTPVSSPL